MGPRPSQAGGMEAEGHLLRPGEPTHLPMLPSDGRGLAFGASGAVNVPPGGGHGHAEPAAYPVLAVSSPVRSAAGRSAHASPCGSPHGPRACRSGSAQGYAGGFVSPGGPGSPCGAGAMPSLPAVASASPAQPGSAAAASASCSVAGQPCNARAATAPAPDGLSAGGDSGRSYGERSDGESTGTDLCSDDSDGLESEPSEDDLAEGHVAEEISSLAMVEAELPSAPSAIPAAGETATASPSLAGLSAGAAGPASSGAAGSVAAAPPTPALQGSTGATPGAAGGGASVPGFAAYPERNLPPKTGIMAPMLRAQPTFLRYVPPVAELLYEAPDALFDEVVRWEADRLSRPELVQNRTVFDSVSSARGSLSAQQAAQAGHLNSRSDPPEDSPPPGEAEEEELLPFYIPEGPDDTTLVFESRFESGNLRRAVQVFAFEYDLLLNPDYNTKSHTQWYFFRVSNTRRDQEYRFNIINMVKPASVYNEGMRPLMYSVVEATERSIGWVRGTTQNIAYYQNGIRRKDKSGTNYYTLTFTVTFQRDLDTVYFTHCYPYSYTDLQKDLMELDKDPTMHEKYRRQKLCDTLAGNACDLLTITSFRSDPAALRARRSVVITARVHPGESNASWIMKGVLEYLLGPSLDARILRDNFVFKIIPMLNPDGVIVGNYRCSLVGHDLNRQWGEPSRKLHPTIFFAKSMLKHLVADRGVVLFIDIHGHSRKKNVFMYGNSDSSSYREKVFPRLLCRNSECFSFDDCCFKMQKAKESTARVVVYRELSVVNAFTLEASFCGADFGPLGDQHFTTRHLEAMGYMMCDAILDFFDPDQSKVQSVCKELQQLYPDDGNSDDVSDSDVDESAALRARRRKKKAEQKKKEKAKQKKKSDKGDSSANVQRRSTRRDRAVSAPDLASAGAEAHRSSHGAGGDSDDGREGRLRRSRRKKSKKEKEPRDHKGAQRRNQADLGLR